MKDTLSVLHQARLKGKEVGGSEGKHNLMVFAESTPLEDLDTGQKSSHCRYFKMKVLDSHKATDANQIVATYVHEKAHNFLG
jgi:hypothetical protein